MMLPVRTAVRLLVGLTLAVTPATLMTLAASPAYSQQRGTMQRVIQGKVEDKNGAAIQGAIVYLKDGHNASIKSAITGDDGTYRFGQLSLSTDYELWAALDGKKSGTRTISQFDGKAEFTINLKIDK